MAYVYGSVMLQDSGGRLDGGNDMSEHSQRIFLTVHPVNDRPSFAVQTRQISRVVLPASSLALAGIASNIKMGPANEMCREVSPWCQRQKLYFEILVRLSFCSQALMASVYRLYHA